MKTTPKIKPFFPILLFFVLFPLITFAGGEEKHCPSLTSLSDSNEALFLTDAYEVIRDICVKASDASWGAFSTSLQAIVAIAIAIYIALATLKNVGSFSQQDIAGYLTADRKGVFPLAVKAAFIIFLLSDQTFVYSYLISPIIGAGAEIGGSGWGSGFSRNAGGLFDSVIETSEEFLKKAYKITALGRILLCLAFLPQSILDWYWTMIPFGSILFIFGWMIILGISFYLLDVLFRLGVGCMILPLGIACGVSRITSYYTKQTWALFINVAFNFVMVGIIIDLTLSMIEVSLSALSEHTNVVKLLEAIPNNKAPEKSDTDAIDEALTMTGFLLLVLSGMISFKLFMSVEQVAEKVSKTASVGKLGQETGGKAMKAAQNVAMAPVKQAGKFAGAVGHEVGDQIKDSETARGARAAWRLAKMKTKKFLGVKG